MRTRTMIAAAAVGIAPPVHAAPAVISAQSVTSPAPDIGSVVYSTGTDTTFQITPSSGAVQRTSGAGARVTSGSTTPALVTVTCTGGNSAGDCLAATETVSITATGTPTARAKPLVNFTVSPGPSAATLTTPTGTTTITFLVGGIPQNGTRNFYVGMDFPISGTSGATGNAQSSFTVTVGKGGKATTVTGTAIAKVYRPIAVQQGASLNFGMIARPRSGSGVATFNPTSGAVSVTGIGSGAFASPSPVLAKFTVSGEGGQTFSISAAPFNLSRSGAPDIVVTPLTSPSTSGVLGGSVGSSGTKDVFVGGTFPVDSSTPLGAYTGTLSITVQYN